MSCHVFVWSDGQLMLAPEVVGSNFQVLPHRQKRLSPGTYGTLVHEIHPKTTPGLWFQRFFIFIPTWGDDPI